MQDEWWLRDPNARHERKRYDSSRSATSVTSKRRSDVVLLASVLGPLGLAVV
jgi:hypothetical protein